MWHRADAVPSLAHRRVTSGASTVLILLPIHSLHRSQRCQSRQAAKASANGFGGCHARSRLVEIDGGFNRAEILASLCGEAEVALKARGRL